MKKLFNKQEIELFKQFKPLAEKLCDMYNNLSDEATDFLCDTYEDLGNVFAGLFEGGIGQINNIIDGSYMDDYEESICEDDEDW